MSITLESVKRINTLKNSIEATTGETYANLTEGIQALKDGYGQGGGTTFEDALGLYMDSKYPSDYLTLSCKNIKNQAFLECTEISKIYLPNVEHIGAEAFYNFRNLYSIRLEKLKSVGFMAFAGCSGLAFVIIETSNENDIMQLVSDLCNNDVFNNSNVQYWNAYIYVPQDVINIYHAANEDGVFGFDNGLIVAIEDNLDLLSESFPDLVEKYGN